MKKTIFLLAPFVLLFSGCASAPQAPLTVTVVKTVVVATPAPLLRPCPISSPPSEQAYMAEDLPGRENLLSNYVISLLSNLKVCNHQIESISKFQTQQQQLYQKDLK
jgi:hypothetical protein